MTRRGLIRAIAILPAAAVAVAVGVKPAPRIADMTTFRLMRRIGKSEMTGALARAMARSLEQLPRLTEELVVWDRHWRKIDEAVSTTKRRTT